MYKWEKCTFACLARMVYMRRQRLKDLLLRVRVVVRTSKMNIITSLFGRQRQNIAPESVPHVQHDNFFFIQSIKSLIFDVIFAVAVIS